MKKFPSFLIALLAAAVILGASAALVKLRTRQLSLRDRESEAEVMQIALNFDRVQTMQSLPAAPSAEEDEDAELAWKHMTPDQRAIVRTNYARWRALKPSAKQELLDRYRELRGQLSRGSAAAK